MIFTIGATLAAFLFLLLLQKRHKTQPDHLLLGWLAILGIHQVLMFFDSGYAAFETPQLLGLSFPFPLLHGPLLYLYARSMTATAPLKPLWMLPHFLAPLFIVVLAMPFYSLPPEAKIAVFRQNGKGYEWYSQIRWVLIVLSGWTYVGLTLYSLRRHQQRVESRFSEVSRITFQWLRSLSIGLGLIWSLVLFFPDTVIFTGVSTLILFIGFFGIHKFPIFFTHPKRENEDKNENNGTIRYAKSGLKTEEADRYYAALTQLMSEKKPYKKPELSLSELAQMLEIHPNHLSQIINEREEKNFCHYINSLRVKEFMKLAKSPDHLHLSLLAIAIDCGFNSKTTFNKYFKLQTGKTPSEYYSEVNP